ncbi:MAG: hypothetical protein ACRDTQ_11420 [Micromonosporaceae bacterium]
MSQWEQPYGAPSAPASQQPGVTSTVKTAVGLTMAVIALCLLEALLSVYILQQTLAEDTSSGDAPNIRLVFGTLLGANLLISIGLGTGAVLSLRRNVAGKVLIWIFGSTSAALRCSCGGMSSLLLYIYTAGGEDPSDLPFSVGIWGVLIAIESLALIAIIIVMAMLATKSASFKNSSTPPSSGPGSRPGPGGPAGPGNPPGPGNPQGPGTPPGQLPQLPPTPGWPGSP